MTVVKSNLEGSGNFEQNFIVPISRRIDRCLLLELSDLHFGSCPNINTQVQPYAESRRFASVIKQAADYKKDHRNETVLIINIIGDTFEGKLHDAEAGAAESLQFAAAKNYLVSGINFLSECFKEVWVFMTPGNHGRNKRRHIERARSDKWDAYETQLYMSIKDILMVKRKNVHCRLFGSHYFIQCFDWTMFCTHGDTIFDPGEPHKSINAKNICAQIDRINANRYKPVDLIFTGHTHQAARIILPRTNLFINAGLLPPLGYAQSLGHFAVSSGQWLVEMTRNYCVGDNRFCGIDNRIDKDKSLDKIIKPYDYDGNINQ